MKLCIYCGSSPGNHPAFAEAARELGALMGKQGHALVYGGGGCGIMVAVAEAVKSAGGPVCGVIPESLIGTEHAWDQCDELTVTQTMRERKQLMDDRADAFVVLPGGFGTLEEVAEILTLKILGYTDRPVILLNTAGYWDPLLALFDHFYATGFAREKYRAHYAVAHTPQGVLDLLKQSA